MMCTVCLILSIYISIHIYIHVIHLSITLGMIGEGLFSSEHDV